MRVTSHIGDKRPITWVIRDSHIGDKRPVTWVIRDLEARGCVDKEISRLVVMVASRHSDSEVMEDLFKIHLQQILKEEKRKEEKRDD